MTSRRWAAVALGLAILLAAPASAAAIKIGYLGLQHDPRDEADIACTDIQLAPPDDPLTGAQLGLMDEKVVADAVGDSFTLDAQKGKDEADLVARAKAMAAAGERFVILDLPDELVDRLAAAAKNLNLTLIDATAHADFLRDRCYADLLHTAASDRMEQDALVQYLRLRNWTKILVLEGPLPRDQVIAASFVAAAQRLRLDIVDTRKFTLSRTPDAQENNNSQLLTGGTDYDVVYVADSEGEFGRYLPYSTQLPRPVVGTAGLVPQEWHWSWDRDGATQVTSRFLKLTDRRREMTGADWSTWIAARSIVTAYARAAGTPDPGKVDAYLRSDKLRLDGSKGYTLNFRSWDGQLRQPIVLATDNAVIAAPPLPGYEHQFNDLDTLGEDQPEHKCQ